MANVLGITRQAYGNYESGKREPNLSSMNKLASFFNVSTDYLLGLTASDIPINQKQQLVIQHTLDTCSALPKATIPILGIIHADIPLLSEQNIIGELDISADLAGRCDFALYVHGNSMIGAGIYEHDILICIEDHTPHNGDIVVALVNGDQTTLKYYINENDHPLLRSANPDYEDIELKTGDLIEGRVVKVVKDPPPVTVYGDYHHLRQEHLVEWNEVIEEATAAGIQPEFVKQFIKNQIQMASQLVQK